MIHTDEFAKDMCKELAKRTSGIEWSHSWAPPGVRHERVDVFGKPLKRRERSILVEVELRRGSPVTNVVKLWKWIADGTLRESPILFQAFSDFYPKGDSRRRNAEFLGSHLDEVCGVGYEPLSFGYKPRRYGKVGAGRRRHHAKLLARRIAAKIRRENLTR